MFRKGDKVVRVIFPPKGGSPCSVFSEVAKVSKAKNEVRINDSQLVFDLKGTEKAPAIPGFFAKIVKVEE